jgi:BirA family biotin operon repressor/biotin-[acetyl-CoA-carboxylase] ligase
MRGQAIDEAAICLAVEAQGCDWHYRHETGSTNVDALEHFANHGREVVAVSESQSAGRGRRGRAWLSPSAANLYCTVGITRDIPASSQGLLSIVTGVALCQTLRESFAAPVNLKWPNDLLSDGRKLGGILIESRSQEGGPLFFAIGFGINVFMSADELAEISQPVTSLECVTTNRLDRTQLLILLIDAVISGVRAFDAAEVEALIEEFAQLDAFHGRRIEVIAGEQSVTGINRGITAQGQLQLETERGLEIFSAAEISLRGVPA